MIDYKKLKLAHELGQLLSNKTGMRVDISLVFMDEDAPGHLFIDYTNDKQCLYEHDQIDLLINDLKELTEPKRAHKYIVGDEVWFLRICGTIDYSHVVEIDFDKNDMYLINDMYLTNGVRWFEEKELFPTKQALIEAQITYWQSLLEPTEQIEPRTFKGQSSSITECDHEYQKTLDKSGRYFINMCHKCGYHYPISLLKPVGQHESDGAKHIMNQASEGLSFTMNKCKKCGEFYK